MRVSVRNGATNFFNIIVLLTFFYLLANPKLVSIPVTESIYLCVKVIVPALFVYMVLARLIIAMPFMETLCTRLGRYGIETEVLLLGVLCGFPVGAKSAIFLYDNGTISKKRAEYLCAFTNNASLSFLLGYVGTALFSDIKIGIRLAIFQLSSSIITAVVLRFTYMKKNDFVSVKKSADTQKKHSGIAEAVTDSAFTMLSVCAFIITFSVIGELALSISNVDGFFRSLLKSFFEFSSGCAMAAHLEPYVAFITVGIAIGFSGLCVMMQVISVMRGKLSPRMYISGRFISAAVLGLLSLIFGIS